MTQVEMPLEQPLSDMNEKVGKFWSLEQLMNRMGPFAPLASPGTLSLLSALIARDVRIKEQSRAIQLEPVVSAQNQKTTPVVVVFKNSPFSRRKFLVPRSLLIIVGPWTMARVINR
jgi:hypothetical protein